MTNWYDEYYDDVVIDRYGGIHVDALKKRGLFKKEFLTRKKEKIEGGRKMKCAYCKQTIPEMRDVNEEPKERTYTVEINGVECEIWVHDDCIPKILSEFFSRPSTSNHYTTGPDDRNKWWSTAPLTIPCSGTTDVPPEPNYKVWCNTKETSSSAYNEEYNENPHIPWKDRVD